MARFESRGSLSLRIRPWLSASIVVTRFRPKPARLNALRMEACTSAPTTTSIGGAPNIPSSMTFHSSRARSACRAVASAVKFAMVAQVTNPPAQSAGNPRASQTHPRTTSSNSDATGDITRSAAFWFQAPASQLAASAVGSIPPFTKPK
jgi:hypothetical protein